MDERNPKKLIFGILLIVFGGTLMYASIQNDHTSIESISEEGFPIVTVRVEGGLCPYGLCWNSITLFSDSTYIYEAGNSDEAVGGNIDEFQKNRLQEEVEKADFEQIRSKKFTGECPTAYDGVETTYTFHRPNETIASCTTQIDYTQDLFSIVEAIRQDAFSN